MASMTRLQLGAGQAVETSSLLLGERLIDGVLALLERRERGACGGAGSGGARGPPLEVFIGDLDTLVETGEECQMDALSTAGTSEYDREHAGGEWRPDGQLPEVPGFPVLDNAMIEEIAEPTQVKNVEVLKIATAPRVQVERAVKIDVGPSEGVMAIKEIVEAPPAGDGEKKIEVPYAPEVGVQVNVQELEPAATDAEGEGKYVIQAQAPEVEEIGEVYAEVVVEAQAAQQLASELAEELMEARAAAWAARAEVAHARRGDLRPGSAVDADGDVSVEKKDNVHMVVKPCPPLPPGWEAATDPESGKPYFFHRADGRARWDPPTLQEEEEERQIERQIRLARIRQRVG